MISIPIKTREDKMKLFNLFQKKEKQGLEKAKADGLITEEEFLRISAERATETLEKFLDKKGRNTHKSAKKT